MYDTDPAIIAGILIGGRSERMGTSKANLLWGSATMLEAVHRTARTVSAQCVLLGTADPLPQALKEVKQIPDIYPGIGPIAGLHALLSRFPDHWCLLLGCDIPRINPQTIATLTDRLTTGNPIIACSIDSRLQPCCALYHPSILPRIQQAIAAGEYALHRLIESIPHTTVPTDAAAQASLDNINTPQDYHPPASADETGPR